MPFYIVRNDITLMNTDAIVNAANCSLSVGAGVCGAIFKAAGSTELQAECSKIGTCNTGEAVITKAYNLPSKYIIHTPGPIWRLGNSEEISLLYKSYMNSMRLAARNACRSIAFPLISSGIYGFPKDPAFKTAVSAIYEFLKTNDMEIYLVIYGEDSIAISKPKYDDIQSYINININCTDDFFCREAPSPVSYKYDSDALVLPSAMHEGAPLHQKGKHSLQEAVKHLDESFSQMLLRLIDEKGLTDVETYKRANIDRKLFSKIRICGSLKP